MNENTILPNSVGRLDPVVDAIRDGDWLAAEAVLIKEWNRRDHECQQNEIRLEKRKSERDAIFNFMVLVTNLKERPGGEQAWRDIRRACGWSGVDGFEGPVETLPEVKPALKAEKLPIGTVMVLGGQRYGLYDRGSVTARFRSQVGQIPFVFYFDELQELIDLGVRFELPKGGAK